MKRTIVLLGLMVCMAGGVNAQKKQQKNNSQKRYTVPQKLVTKEAKKVTGPVYRLNSTSTWNAQGAAPAINRTLRITDPTVRILNERSSGWTSGFRAHEVMGVGKRMYGFANGHILLRTNSTTTSGTYTGSGSVGTGSSPGLLGAMGPGMGVNGVSPNSGTGMNTIPATVVPNDVNASPVGRKGGVKKKDD
jgi:hypothetical protein